MAFRPPGSRFRKFLGADHVWGLHWPGVPLIYSALLPLLPWSVALWLCLFIGMVGILAWQTYRLITHYVEDRWLAAAGATIVLADRTLFGIMLMSRTEALSLVVLTALASLLRRWHPPAAGTRRRVAAAGLCFFLLPMLHPMLLPIGGMLCLYAAARAWQRGQNAHGLAYTVSFVAGTMALAGWFYFQPDAWLQFQTNARANYQPFSWGASFANHLLASAPTYTNVPLFLLAFSACVALWPAWWRKFRSLPLADDATNAPETAQANDWGIPLGIFLSGIASAQLFPNQLYHVIVLPFTILLAIEAFRQLARRWLRPAAMGWVALAVLAFAALHGAFWFTRTTKYFQGGRPHLRAEASAIYHSLPANRRIVAPTIMWREGIVDPNRFLLNTLPFPSAPQVRQAYEEYVFKQMQPGDLLVISRLQKPAMLNPLPPAEWEYVQSYEHHLPGKNYWGYDLKLYRKR